MRNVRIHAFVSGLVQGVNFRYNTKRFAESLGVVGWVKNLKDGRVEVLAEGSEIRIKHFLDFLKKGPPGSKVISVEVKEEEYKGEFKFFDILYS
ncbi:MAG: acylphosphatase [Candidatus Aenigmatarchaeota archaeon]